MKACLEIFLMTFDEASMIKCCREKGSLNWLTTLAIADIGFAFSKQKLKDAVWLRRKLDFDGLPGRCPCGENVYVNHAVMCK